MATKLLGGRDLLGYFTEVGQGYELFMREMRLTYDGEYFKLVRAKAPPITLPVDGAYFQIQRHRHGPWQVHSLRWAIQDGLLVDLIIRPDGAVQKDAEMRFKGALSTLPRILVTVSRRDDGKPIGEGALATEDQPGVLPMMRKFFAENGVPFLSFARAQELDCEEILSENLVRTRL